MFLRHKSGKFSILGVLIGVGFVATAFSVADDSNDGCYEDNKAAGFTYACAKDAKTCPQDPSIQTTVTLGVDAGVIVTGVSGGVSFTYTIGGCDPSYLPGDMRYKGICDRELSVEFTSGTASELYKLRLKSCEGTFKVYSCKASTSTKNFTLPNSIVDSLNALAPGDPIAYGASIPLPVIACIADQELQRVSVKTF